MSLSRSKKNPLTAPRDDALNVNQVVAINLRLAREQAGWTQTTAAAHLTEITGRTYTKSTISAMERSSEPGSKRSLFDAHELLEFSRVFAKPMVWFLMPSEEHLDEQLQIYGQEHGRDLIHFIFGNDWQQESLKSRLAGIRDSNPDAAEDISRALADFDKETWIAYIGARGAATESALEAGTPAVEQALDNVMHEMTEFKKALVGARRLSMTQVEK
jgi:transcriptional regulator with XRE-family HTH domain